MWNAKGKMEKYLTTKILKTTKPFTGRVKVTAEWVFRLTYVFYSEIVHLLFQQRFSIDRYRDRRVTKIEPFSLSWSSCYVAGYSLRASQTIDLKNRKNRTYFSGLKSDPYFPKKKKDLFALMKALQKWWKMLFTSSWKLFSF